VSCLELQQASPGSPSGVYTIDPDGAGGSPAASAYCDMVSFGGGWTLVTWGFRPAGAGPYLLPTLAQGSSDPGTRQAYGAIDASLLVRTSGQAILSVREGAPATGDLFAYDKVFRFNIPSPGTAAFSLADPPNGACNTLTVTELKSGQTFTAFTMASRPLQVACSGHKNGTPYERQFIGFNSAGCYGICGADPVTSMGMVVWTGTGYVPTTSGGLASPERIASFGLWLR
jgi:hypothetical protein